MEFNDIPIGVTVWYKRYFKSCLVFPIDFKVNQKIMTSTDDVTSPKTAISNLHHTSLSLCLRTTKSVIENIKVDSLSVNMIIILHTCVVELGKIV